jgi:hypothetical protein
MPSRHRAAALRPRLRWTCPASRRTAPILPLRPGLPESRSHDYVLHGTTTLFAALEVATGKVLDACYARHRHQEFLRFLKHVAKAYPRRKPHPSPNKSCRCALSPLVVARRS